MNGDVAGDDCGGLMPFVVESAECECECEWLDVGLEVVGPDCLPSPAMMRSSASVVFLGLRLGRLLLANALRILNLTIRNSLRL